MDRRDDIIDAEFIVISTPARSTGARIGPYRGRPGWLSAKLVALIRWSAAFLVMELTIGGAAILACGAIMFTLHGVGLIR